jgi:hypothetical protein
MNIQPSGRKANSVNLFARELDSLLARFHKKLGNLYGLAKDYPHQFVPNKIARLARAEAEDLGATLNPAEVQAVAAWLKLEPEGETMLRLRAALLAEGMRQIFLRRMKREGANHLGELTFQLLLAEQPECVLALRQRLLAEVR